MPGMKRGRAALRGLLLIFLFGPLQVAAGQPGAGRNHSVLAGADHGQHDTARPGSWHPGRSRRAGPDDSVINVNAADAAALVALKGVGEKKARAIVAYRKTHGPFSSLDEFEEVPGIGPALIEANRERIRFR